MASLDMEAIKDVPGYKVILKAVLRAQIQQLVKQLSEHTEEESVILTANVSDGTLSHLGSDYGKMFLETYSDVKKSFLGFCLQSHHSKQASDGSNETTAQEKSKLLYNSKIHTKVLVKPRHSPYTSSRPQSNSPSGLKRGYSGISSKSDGEVEESDKTSSQDKGETEDLNSVSLIKVKQEPEDVTDETSEHSVKHTNIDWDESVSLSGREQLAQDSEVKSQREANSAGANTSLSLLDYSDSLNQGAGQWADNSEFKLDATFQAGFHESLHGNDSKFVSTAEASDAAVYFESKRGGTKMSYKGFVYNEDRQGKARIYWRCQSRRCKGGNSSDSDKMPSNNNGKLQDLQKTCEIVQTKDTASDVEVPLNTDQNDSQSNSKDVDTSDTDVYEDPSSRDDSIKDYLSDDENKLNMTNSDTDIDVEDTVRMSPSESGSVKQSLNVIKNTEISAESVDVMHEVHQTVNKMTHCVARAISEERKENSIEAKELNQQQKEHVEIDMHGKPYKVLAVWNKIADDFNEVSSEVLYDLLADTLKEKLGKHSLGNKMVEKNQINYSNVVSSETESMQTDVAHKPADPEMQTDAHTSESFENRKCSEESIQTEDNLLDKATEKEDSRKYISGKSDSEKHYRQNSGTQTAASVSVQSQVCASSAGLKENTEKKNELGSKHETKEPSVGTVVIDIDHTLSPSTAPTTAQCNDTAANKSSQMKTPIKHVTNKQIVKGSPRQLKTQSVHANKHKQNRQQVSPSKPGNSFIDNLISKGVPIIIPDDDDEGKHGKKEFMPSPRSTAFEMKSKHYHDEMKRISHVEQRQNFAYNPQAASPMTPSSSFMKQHNLPYLQQRQQYQYQDYHDDQQYSNQQFQSQESLQSEMSAPLLRQQLFTPPKNVAPSTTVLGLSPKGALMKSPLNSLSHQFSPTSTPTSMNSLSQQFSPSTPTSMKGSPYFKQSYITPTKQPPKLQINQSGIHLTQLQRQKRVVQQKGHSLSFTKAGLSSNTTIVIDDEPAEGTESPVVKNLLQKQTCIVKSPQPNQSVPHSDPSQSVSTVLAGQVSSQELLTSLSSSSDNSLHGLPVIANVESVSELKNENTTSVHTHVTHVVSKSSAELNVDQDLIRQTNECTPIKRRRSDDTMTSPGHLKSGPSMKRRHTSVDGSAQPSDLSSGNVLECNSKSQLEQSSDCQVSPSKIPPKLEIDIDDVPGVLQDPSNQTTTLRSPCVPSNVSLKGKEESPIIPLSSQLVKQELAPFSPPVSPSTRRLHATHGTRSKTTSESSSVSSSTDSDILSVAPKETTPQPVKKFSCGDCGKSFTTKAALNQHFRKHTKERPFECDVCGKHYSQKGYLKKHIRTHFETQET